MMIELNPRNSIKGWYFTKTQIQEAIEKDNMLNPSIDLTNACNLNCSYCYIEEKNSTRKKRRHNELTLAETIQVIDDLYTTGAKTVNLVGAGEPTIDPHFKDVVEYINLKEMVTVLFTNGIKLVSDPDLIDFIYDNNVSPILKYNSSSTEIQDLVAGKKGYTCIRNKALDILIDRGFNNGLPTRLGIDIIAFKGNTKEIPKIHSWCRENNIYPLAGEYIPTGRTENGQFQGEVAIRGFSEIEYQKTLKLLQPISFNERFELISKLESIDNEFGIIRDGCPSYFGGSSCTQGLGLYIDIEGNIWPCIARKKDIQGKLKNGLLGNTKAGDKLSFIWKNDRYLREIRENYSGRCLYKPKLTFKQDRLNEQN